MTLRLKKKKIPLIFVLNLENERVDYQDWMQTNTVKYPSSLVGYCGLFGVRHEKSVLTSPKEEHETRRGIGVWIAVTLGGVVLCIQSR